MSVNARENIGIDIKKLSDEGFFISMTRDGIGIIVSIEDLVNAVKKAFTDNGIPINVTIDYEKRLVRFMIPLAYIQSLISEKKPEARGVIDLLNSLGINANL